VKLPAVIIRFVGVERRKKVASTRERHVEERRNRYETSIARCRGQCWETPAMGFS
jgi:hypothetical protein